MHALLLTGLLLLLALGYYLLLDYQARPRPEPLWLIRARQRFWLALYTRLTGRVRRIWRFCRRHFGWGIEILQNAQLMLHYLV